MTSNKTDDLGDRMKRAENRGLSLSHVLPGETMVARLDGRSFSNFTKGMLRPYDEEMSNAMIRTGKKLIEKFHADVMYTQSDELTLIWFTDPLTEVMFGGRVQKIVSSLAAMCSVQFHKILEHEKPGFMGVEDAPTFDCRVFTLPSKSEAINNLIWRQQDAVKNAISMAAQSMFSHKELQGKNGSEMQEMMHSVHGVNFNDYPAFFKRGTFARRMKTERVMTKEELDRMPEAIRQVRGHLPVIRSNPESFDCWITKAGDTQEERFKALFDSSLSYN